MAAGKKYLRCGCPTCGNVITYPDYSAGGTSVCDKCGKTVKLPAAPKTPPPPPARNSTAPVPQPDRKPSQRRSFLRFVLWAMNLAVIAAVVLVVLNRRPEPTPTDPTLPTNAPAFTPPPPVATPTVTNTPIISTPAPATNLPPPTPAPMPTTNVVTITNVVTLTNAPTATNPPTPPAAAGTNTLTVLGLSIERPRGNKGSRLTYVTGVLQNQSDAKRFGVRIDLNLLDRARNNVGMATDYTPLIEPKGTWRFRALVLDARAVTASVAAIKEDQ